MVKLAKDYKTKTVVIHDPEIMAPGESITLKGYVGDLDRQAVLSAASEYRRAPDGTVTIIATLDKMARTRRTCAVVGWTLFYDDGTTPIPYSPEALASLPSEVTDFLDREISRVWDGLGDPLSAEQQVELEAGTRAQEAAFRGPGAGAHERGTARPGQHDDGRARATGRDR